MDKHPSWNESNPKNQMDEILMALKGLILVYLKDDRPDPKIKNKVIAKFKSRIKQLEMLSDSYMKKEWEEKKMNLGDILREKLERNELERRKTDEIIGIKMICNSCKLDKFSIYTRGKDGWQFKCEYCGVIHNA